MRVIKLCKGEGNGVDSACLMTAASMLIGKPEEGDETSCVCFVLRSFIIPTNDEMPNGLRNELYGPLVWEILGTKTNDLQVLVERSQCFADWAQEIATAIPFTAAHSVARTAAAYAKDAAATYAKDDARTATATAAAAAAAADVAARAADAADVAADSADAAAAIWRECPEIIRKVAAIGDKRPVETVMTMDALAEALNK